MSRRCDGLEPAVLGAPAPNIPTLVVWTRAGDRMEIVSPTDLIFKGRSATLLAARQRDHEGDPPQKVRWQQMRCVRCGRLLQKVEEHALRPGKQIEIKCTHCKVVNYLVGTDVADS